MSSERNDTARGDDRGETLQRPSLGEDLRSYSGGSTGSTSATNASNAFASPMGSEKPVVSANGLTMFIHLAEPTLYLHGMDAQELQASPRTTMLRGSMVLRVSKPSKLKSISLRFRGRAMTDWPEGIPPRKIEFKDVESLMNHTWTFFNFQFPNADSHCADSVLLLKGPRTTTTEVTPGVTASSLDSESTVRAKQDTFLPKDFRRMSLQIPRSSSYGRGEAAPVASTKGYRVFMPGEYTYNFELPLDSRMPETIHVELGQVKYELEGLVERAGAFRTNLMGSKELKLIRAPAESSLEMVEPIAISRDWEDQLHYDIVISGKSFPLGAQVPIAFKLTPLAKVQCHRIKVYITENIQYFTSNKRVHRLEPTRKIQLFEKRADGPHTSAYPGSQVRIISGGGIAWDDRAAAAAGEENLERDRSNLLGSLDGEHNIGPTEMEVNVQLPTCHQMAEKEKNARIHFDTTYTNIQVHHWIKIVLRLSKPDMNAGGKRRHFEISIDSPFTVLSCLATQAHTSLPAYTSPNAAVAPVETTACGCPTATRNRPPITSSNTPISASPFASTTDLARPPAAHTHDNQPVVSRPMHLLRAPSFNPPPWSDDDPPPPLITPPPKYETLVDDPHSGLADYFSRLADEMGDDEIATGPGRVEVPLTPGGRTNRSMDESRSWLPVASATVGG